MAAIIVSTLLLLISSVDCFISNKDVTTSRLKPLYVEEEPLTYGEESRKFRRTYYFQEDWVRHRDPIRFQRNLETFFESGVVKNLSKEVSLVAAVATTVVFWNCLAVDGYIDLSGNFHPSVLGLPSYLRLELPADPFRLSSSALGLLLVFRTNASYGRWNEARTNWGKIINHSRNIARLASSWTLLGCTDENMNERKEKLQRTSSCVWAFPRSLTRHLLSESEDEEDFQRDVIERLDIRTAESLITAKHRPTNALFHLSNAVDQLPLSFVKRIEIDKSIVILCDMMGACERIYNSPVPLVYSRMTSRFVSIWLLLLPLSLWTPFASSWNHITLIPASCCLAIFFFGIEELSIQLEEPFSVLAMHTYTNGIGNIANSYVDSHMKTSMIDMSEEDSIEVDMIETKIKDTSLPEVLEPMTPKPTYTGPSFGYTFSPAQDQNDIVKP